MMPQIRRWHFYLLTCIIHLPLSAQPGLSEFRAATGTFHRWYFHLSDLILVIGALSGTVGALRIYVNWQTGKRHHIDAQVMAWLFSCIFLSILGASLQALFGI